MMVLETNPFYCSLINECLFSFRHKPMEEHDEEAGASQDPGVLNHWRVFSLIILLCHVCVNSHLAYSYHCHHESFGCNNKR